MKKTTNKFLSIILSVLLLFSVMPITVFATGSVASVTTALGVNKEYDDIHEAFAFACENAGSTITLLSDIDLGTDEIHIVDCDIILELNGKTLSSTSDEVIYLHRGGKMLIKDSVGSGTIKNTGNNSFAIVNFGELTIESGTFIGKKSGVFTADKVVIKDGTFTGDEYGLLFWLGGSVNVDDKCDLDIGAEWLDGKGQILGGTFINGIYIKNWGGDIYDFYEPILYLLDILADGYGFFGEDGNEIFATEYQLSITENITVKESKNERPNAARVELANGEIKYFIDLWEALRLANWSMNSKLTLLKDSETSKVFKVIGCGNFILDLNGKVLSSSGNTTLELESNFGLPFTIIDSVGGGEIRNTAESNGIAINADVGKLVLEDITVTSASCIGIYSADGGSSVTINGGKVYGKEYGIKGCTKLTLTDGVISSDSKAIFLSWYSNNGYNWRSSKANISGGIIKGGIECAKNGNLYLSDTLCEGYYFYDTEGNPIELTANQLSIDGTVTIKNRYPVSVTQPDGTTEYFPTVDEGKDKADESFDSKLKLLTDILLNSSLDFFGTTTLDLNGKNIATNDEYDYTVIVDDGASLNIEDSADSGTIGGGGVAVNGGTLNFNNGSIESSMDGIYNNGGSVTVNGGAISGGEGYDDIFVEGENTTIVYGGTYEDGFSIGGTTINETLADGYVFYNGDGAIEIEDNQKVVSDNVVVYEKTIVTAMSSQIRFNTNDDGSYAGTFDVRTRAKISDADFKKYIADTNEEAIEKISKVGFVYSTSETEFDIESAKTVAQGGTVEGFTNAPVSYIQDADGYYVFTCIVTGITEEYLDNGITTYAYICIEDTWYFFPVEVTAEFGELFGKYYPLAAEKYGW